MSEAKAAWLSRWREEGLQESQRMTLTAGGTEAMWAWGQVGGKASGWQKKSTERNRPVIYSRFTSWEMHEKR